MRKKRSALRNRLEFAAYGLALRLSAIGGRAFHEAVGTRIGIIFHRVGGRRRRILEFNLQLAFPELTEEERKELGFGVARHFGRALLSSLRLQRSRPEKILAAVELGGLEHLRGAIASERGFFILSAHLGAWEVAALRSGLEIPSGLAVVHRPLDNPLLDRRLEQFRALHGNRMLSKRGATRPILAEIRKGGAVGILIDQRAGVKGSVEVPFFGHPARTHLALARIVLKTGSLVLPTWAWADGGGRYSMQIEAPVSLKPGDTEVDLTVRYTEITERAIRRRPEQWLWYHDRWRDYRLSTLSSSSDPGR